MEEFNVNKSIGYKKLSDPECGRTKQTHLGLTDSFFNFLNEDNNHELVQEKSKFYYENSITDSSCHINAIKDDTTGDYRNPKLTSGKLVKGTVFKLIKEIGLTNTKEYYLVWEYSNIIGRFLLIEKDKVNFDLIKQLDDKSIKEEIKVKLIETKFAEIDNLSKELYIGESINSLISNKKLTEFSLSVIVLLIKEFGDEFIVNEVEKFNTKVGGFKHVGYKLPKYFKSVRIFGAFENDSIFKQLLDSKERTRYHALNLDFLKESNIYFSTEIEFNKTEKSSNLYFGDFKTFIEDYSIGKYSIKKVEENYVLFELNSSNIQYKQEIYFGSPGTGKSRLIKNEFGNNWPRVTFHPELDYQGFVGTYKPIMKPISDTGTKEEISYEYVPEAFVKAYCKAWKSNRPYYLIIEEINRGNCAQIFGDIFQLLDRNDEGYSEYPIECSPDIQRFLKKEFEKNFDRMDEYEIQTGSTDYSKMVFPNNLSILATMNTSDQSLFPMDSAFKRRWDWQYVPIDYEDATTNLKIIVKSKEYNWGRFILKVNKEIKEHTQSEDKQIGNRFVSPINGIITAEQFVSKVLFYLWTEIYKDEQGTGNTIFINPSNDGELTFGDFFRVDGKVNNEVLINFLDYTIPNEKKEIETSQVIINSEGESEN